MKTLITVAMLSMTSLAVGVPLAQGQKGFTPAFPDKPPNFTQVGDDDAWVKGHWVGEHMVGPESSEISCDKKSMTCTDTQANITVIGGTFTMTGDVTEYTIERWTSREIVATVSGRAPCHLRQVLKFDRVAKRVSWMASLSEPLNDSVPKSLRDVCTASQMNLDLRDGTSWMMH
jgi:hypothetical protein